MENQEKIPTGLLVFNGVLVISIIFFVFLIYGSISKSKIKIATIKEPIVVMTKSFDNVNLLAKSVYVFDVAKNEVIFKKNETAQLPLASLTKLMTALTATDLLPANSKITIRKEFLNEEGNNGLLENESWKLKNLLDFSLVTSSNDGMRSVASVIGATIASTNDYDLGRKDFVEKMNEKAKTLGLAQTYFINESGLDEGQVSGGYGSAENVEKLMQYIITNKPQILEATKKSADEISSLSKTHTAINTNIDINKIPGLIASKTGYTELAGGNLAVAFDASIGRPIIVVVLGSTADGRFSDVNQLVKASLDYVNKGI